MNLDQSTIIAIVSSITLAYIMPKLSPYIDRSFKKLLATPLKGYFRKKRLKQLCEFRKMRVNASAVTMQIVKTNAYYILFWGAFAAFFFLMLIAKPALPSITWNNIGLFFIILSPVLIIELKWLFEESKAESLVKGSGKLYLWKAAQARRKAGLNIDSISLKK
jgi:hypothetical protein